MHSNMEIVELLRDEVEGVPGMKESKMFGGISFLLNGNMCVGIWHDWMIARVGVEAAETGLESKECEPMDITGRPMKGWLKVDVLNNKHALHKWTGASVDFVSTLPKK